MQDKIPDALIAAFERHYAFPWDEPTLRNERLAWRAAWTEATKPCLHQIQEPAPAAVSDGLSKELADARDAVLAQLDGLLDDAAAHIYPSDLNKFQTGEHTATVASVRMGNSSERSVPLYSREQVVEAFNATWAAQGEKHEG